jgi:hypothetical protein
MHSLDLSRVAPVAAAALIALTGGVHAQRTTTILQSGDSLPGGGVLDLAGSPRAAIASDGAWALQGSAGAGRIVLLVDGALRFESGDPLGPTTFFSAEDLCIGPAGHVVFVHRTMRALATSLLPSSHGLFRDGQLLLESRAGAAVQTPVWGGTVEALTLHGLADDGRALLQLLVADGATGELRHALATFDTTAPTPTVDVFGWTGVPAMPGFGLELGAILGQPRLDGGGNAVWHARFGTTDCLFVGTTPVLVEGSPAPVAGTLWAHQGAPIAADSSGAGNWAARAQLDSGETILVRDGQLVRRSGDPVAALGGAGVDFDGFDDSVWLTERGDLLWRGSWEDAVGTHSGLFMGDAPVLATGMVTDRGHTVDALTTIASSPGGRYVLVAARLPTPPTGAAPEAWLRVELPLGERYGAPSSCSSGAPGLLNAYGESQRSANDLVLAATSLPSGSFGVLLGARQRGSIPLPGCQGPLLVAPPIKLWSDRVTRADGLGRAEVRLDLNVPWIGTPPTPGETWHFQLWFRDVDPTPTTNTTNGVSVAFE